MIEACVVNRNHGVPLPAFVKRGTDIYTCPTCGCIMGDLAFVHQQYEADDYYTMSLHDRHEIEQEWGFRWRYVLNKIKQRVPAPRLLDVGAGNGYFVYLASAEFGYDAHGVEISDAEIKYARDTFGIALRKAGTIPPTEKFNVVTSFNVLEHVNDPLALLRDMNRYLSKDGYLFLTTPNPDCIHRRVKGLQAWGMVDPPHHINLFTRRSLTEIVSGSGFAVSEYQTLSTYIRFVRKWDRNNVLRASLFHALRLFNLGADHLVVCRKVADI